jgi:hypothetical protein
MRVEPPMMKTSKREIRGALFGALIGAIFPLALHFLLARTGDAEAMGIPIIAFSRPGFFTVLFQARISRLEIVNSFSFVLACEYSQETFHVSTAR